MVKFGISRTGLGVGWAHPARLPRRTRSFGCVRAAEVTTSPLRVKKLDEESGKYLVNYKGGFNPKFKKRVLGIDGGGVRGLVPATVLITVERVIAEYLLKNYRDELPPGITSDDIEVDIADYFDIISGTSVGCIVALYIGTKGGVTGELLKELGSTARPGSAQGIADIIYSTASEVFPRRWYERIPLIGSTVQNSRLLLEPKYSPDGLETLLRKTFGDLTLKTADTRVLVPAFNITRNTALSFWGGKGLSGTVETVNHTEDRMRERKEAMKKSEEEEEEQEQEGPKFVTAALVVNSDGKSQHLIPDVVIDWKTDFRLQQVARASAAAPTFFSAAMVDPIDESSPDQGSKPDFFIDGGVIANNPVMQSLTLALTEIKLEGEPNPDISDVAVLSLGTGSTLPKTKNLERAGAFQWLASGALINTMMDGTSRYLQALIDDVYHRLKKESTILGQYVRIDNIDEYSQEYAEVLSVMDDPGNVDALREIGEELGRECYGVIKEYIELCLVKEDN